jgi:hypothetical protein
MTPVERQVRTLLRAWPVPDRIERGDEIAGTTLDLVSDDAGRVPFALALNLVIGGLRARWRARPPLWRWLGYRMGGRLPTRWHRWMLNDLTSRGWRRRMLVSRLAFGLVALGLAFTVVQLQFSHTGRWDLLMMLAPAVGFVAGTFLPYRARTRKDRQRLLARHGYSYSGQNLAPWPPPPWARTTADAEPQHQAPSPPAPERR